MTMYARSDITDFSGVLPCGGHAREVLNEVEVRKGADPKYGSRLVVDCPLCEPTLLLAEQLVWDQEKKCEVNIGTWAADPSNIPMTGAEKRLAEQAREEAQAAALRGQVALGQFALDMVAKQSAPADPDYQEFLTWKASKAPATVG